VTDQLHTLLTELAGPPKVIDPADVKARARRLEAARRRRRITIGAAAAAVLVVGGVLVVRPSGDSDRRVETTDSTEAPPTTVAASGWSDLARLEVTAMTEANTMQDDGRTLVWTGSLVVIPGLREAITFDPATATFGSLPPAPVDLSSTRGSYRGNLPWVWTGEEILRIDPTPLVDASGNRSSGPLVGQAFAPATGTWRRMADAPVEHFTGVAWADDELLAWSREGVHAYHPDTDAWELLTDQPGAAGDATSETGTWTGTELVLVGRNAAATFDPTDGTWRALPPPTPPLDRTGTTASPSTGAGIVRVQWTGTEVVAHDADTGTIHRLDLASGTWQASPANGLVARQATRSALWAGDRFVVWGGPVHTTDANSSMLTGYAQDGATWDPNTDSWSPIADLRDGMIPMSGVVAGDRFIALFQDRNGTETDDDDDSLVVLELHP
jgi:hypothetical protein